MAVFVVEWMEMILNSPAETVKNGVITSIYSISGKIPLLIARNAGEV